MKGPPRKSGGFRGNRAVLRPLAARVDASVVIPTHNRAQLLARVLRYWGVQEVGDERFELVVVDDGSTDDTGALFGTLGKVKVDPRNPLAASRRDRIWKVAKGVILADEPRDLIRERRPIRLTYVQIEKSGRSVARNIGIALAAAPLIIFADDDIFVEPSFVKKHLAAHIFNERAVVMGKVIHTPSLDTPLSARWKLKDVNTAFLATGNASAPRDLLIEAGLFDEGYTVYGWEDFDLGIHLQELGVRSLRRPIAGYHYDPPLRTFVPADVYNKERERGISAVYFYRNHPLAWVRRFTLLDNRVLQGLVGLLGRGNWFLKKSRVGDGPLGFLRGPFRLLVRYKGYFDGVAEGKRRRPPGEEDPQ